MSMSASCPFCLPARERVQFANANEAAALVNLKPILPGHSLIVPDRHAARLLDLEPAETGRLFAFAQRISRLLMDEFAADGIDWTVQDGPEAGQTVMHLHVHLIPRSAGDLPSPGEWYPELRASEERPDLSDADLTAVIGRLRTAARAIGF